MKKTNGRATNKRNSNETATVSDLVKIQKGLISPRIFTDPMIGELELERIFARSWLFVAHESEVRQPGDFVTRTMGEDPVIVWRGQDGKVRVFLNVCRHRGRRVCGEDMGKAAQMRCPYHGWTYSNVGEVISVPFYEGYQGKLEKEKLGLYEAAKVESYQGLIFANWGVRSESLGDYLGEMRWVLDMLFGRTGDIEVVGPPMRWEADSNWKLAAANFAGDGIHLFTTHGFRGAMGLEDKMRGERVSYRLMTEKGHASALTGFKGRFYLALPQEIWPQLRARLTPDHLRLMEPLLSVVGNIFPNASFLCSGQHTPAEWGGEQTELVSFLTLRVWQPKGVDKMEIWSWCFVDKSAPDWWKEASKECYLRTFGMAGQFEQDDMENWGEVTRALRSPVARRLWLQYQMGLGGPPKERPIPGLKDLYKSSLGDDSERVFYAYWRTLISRE